MFAFARRLCAGLLTLVAVWAPVTPAAAAGYGPVPAVNGYTITARQDLTPYLVYVQYRSSNPRRVINVAFLRRGGPQRLGAVLSNDRVAGPNPKVETISSMCKRVKCRIAVNGDFFSRTTGQPAGGMSIEGDPIRTPPDARYHFFADWAGYVGVRKIAMPSKLYATYPNGQKPIYVHSINTARAAQRAVLYSRKWGYSTETTTTGFELVMRITNHPLKMDKTMNVTITGGATRTNTPIPADGLVLSGSGGHATALATLWNDVRTGKVPAAATLMLDSVPNLRTYVGGTPALLQGGRQAFTNDGSSFMTARDPKTMVGRRSNGDAILAVVDGRQPSWSVGVSMTEAMQFMRSLGATDALNLDGGGSSEFVKYGSVMNKPSDGRERPIAAALTIVG